MWIGNKLSSIAVMYIYVFYIHIIVVCVTSCLYKYEYYTNVAVDVDERRETAPSDSPEVGGAAIGTKGTSRLIEYKMHYTPARESSGWWWKKRSEQNARRLFSVPLSPALIHPDHTMLFHDSHPLRPLVAFRLIAPPFFLSFSLFFCILPSSIFLSLNVLRSLSFLFPPLFVVLRPYAIMQILGKIWNSLEVNNNVISLNRMFRVNVENNIISDEGIGTSS